MTEPAVQLAAPLAAAGGRDEWVIRLSGISKRYGHTQALDNVQLGARRGEIIGLLGHNGAGKSTLMRVAVGLTTPDSGSIEVGGQLAEGYDPRVARASGVRIAFQELSLSATLRVFENVLVARPSLAGWGWRAKARQLISDQLDQIFPGHGISPWARIASLSLAQQQMVEIAQAAIGCDDSEVKLLILDEPTSALPQEAAENLFRFLHQQQERGLACILISHRMGDLLGHSDRMVIMRDGKVVAERASKELQEDEAVNLMGAAVSDEARKAERRATAAEGEFVVEVRKLTAGRLHELSMAARPGEIIGLAGLEGQGQRDLLLELWRRRRRAHGGAVRIRRQLSFVTGDRQSAGVFPLWSLLQNVSIGSMRKVTRLGAISPKAERELAGGWIERLEVRGRADSPILDLSGGNQQKVLVARALASAAEVILLDDPFRGVDVPTKRETYRLLREETGRGRCFVWFTSENAELEQCDRVYVFRAGRIVAELTGEEISEERIIGASFARSGEES